jgi:hypothetical protein
VPGKELRRVDLGNNSGGWWGLEALPGGRFLVAYSSTGKVMEVDAAGRVVSEIKVAGACNATRLPDGHVLVASMTHRRIVEVDREGKTIKEFATVGRPWKIHRR